MDFLQLNYFAAVAKTENFTIAAKELHISQSSLSQTISRLEKEIGYQLFDRCGRTIRLNKSGQIFLSGIQDVNHTLKNTIREINDIHMLQTREISIYVGCASMCLPQLLGDLRSRCNNITFKISQTNHSQKVSSIAPNHPSQQYDADFSITSQDFYSDDENSLLLLEEDIMLALPKDHPLSSKSTIHLHELLDEDFISLNNDWNLGNFIDSACQKKNFLANITISVDNPSIMRELLNQKMGVAFIPQKTWNTKHTHEKLVMKRVKDFNLKRYVYLSWRKNSYLSDDMKTCITCIHEFFKNIST